MKACLPADGPEGLRHVSQTQTNLRWDSGGAARVWGLRKWASFHYRPPLRPFLEVLILGDFECKFSEVLILGELNSFAMSAMRIVQEFLEVLILKGLSPT